MDATLLSQLFIWAPTLLTAGLFFFSYRKEPRQFRNAIYLLTFLGFGTLSLGVSLDAPAILGIPIILLMISPMVAVIFLLVNTVIVVYREGFRLANILPGLLAGMILAVVFGGGFLVALGDIRWVTQLYFLFVLESLWFFYSFAALLLYSTMYRLLPRKRRYDYIIVHGAGLIEDQPTPLLRGRLDKALALWEKQGSRGTIIVSGGQGADEVVSEAYAMRSYLEGRGVHPDVIVDEDRSTTTHENLLFSRDIMDRLSAGKDYRAAVVTSDYHVFRCAEYAHNLGIRADGVGSHTRGYYWPTAFIREFIAITRAHLTPYYIIAGMWALAWAAIVVLSQIASMYQ